MDKLTRSIIDGVLQHVSPSQIKNFNAELGGCERKHGFDKGVRVPRVEGKNAKIGTAGHERIEHYGKTGSLVLTAMEMPGRIWIDQTRAETGRVIIEPPIDKANAIKIAGVAMVGRLDFLNASGVYIDNEGDSHDQEWPEVVDWKFSGEPYKWAKTADELMDDLPGALYAIQANELLGIRPEKWRLSQVYFGIKRRESFKRTCVVPTLKLVDRLKRTRPIVRRMTEAAKVFRSGMNHTELVAACNTLTPNFKSCGMHRGCPYDAPGLCDKSPDDMLESLCGPDTFKIDRIDGSTVEEYQPGEETMGVLEDTAFGDHEPSTTAEENTPETSVEAEESMADRMARLEAAEENDKLAPIKDAIARIAAHGKGMPTFKGEAAQAAAAAEGNNLATDATIPGSLKLSKFVVDKAKDIVGLADELDRRAKASGEALKTPAPIEPPDSPPKTVETAAEPVDPSVTLNLDPEIANEAEIQRLATLAAAAEGRPSGKGGRPSKPKTLKQYKKAELIDMIEELQRVSGYDMPPRKPVDAAQAVEELDALRDEIADLTRQLAESEKSLRDVSATLVDERDMLRAASSDTAADITVAKIANEVVALLASKLS